MTTFSQLTPGLWVMQCRSMAYNTGVWISNGQACLIDSGLFADELEAIARLLAEQKATPAVMVLTHSHWDHILGPEYFTGVRIVAQANYLREVKQDSERIRKSLARWENAENVRREKPFVIPMPDDVIEESSTLTIGNLTLRAAHVPGHAADQLALYDPQTETLWASDILSDVEIPFVSDNLAAYERTLAMLAEWKIAALVPGHGSPTTEAGEVQRRLKADRAYLAELRERVEAAVRAGKTIEETVTGCEGMNVYRKEGNERFERFNHGLNVESAYIELGGQADPNKYGWARE